MTGDTSSSYSSGAGIFSDALAGDQEAVASVRDRGRRDAELAAKHVEVLAAQQPFTFQG